MITQDDLPTLKAKLQKKNVPTSDIEKCLAYLSGAVRDEEAREKKDRSKGVGAVRANSVDTLYTLLFKWHNLGLNIDGVNVAITGFNQAMPTYHGYKNKVKQTYPTAKFDVQLIREDDTFKFSKKNGKVNYEHDMANPFEEKPIAGAYCVISIDDKDYFEALNPTEFEKMKDSSRMKWLWGEWASEFWLKSVLKRGCKRHFNDVTAEIDKMDNEEFGLKSSYGDVKLPAETLEAIDNIRSYEDADLVLSNLPPELKVAAQMLIDTKIDELV